MIAKETFLKRHRGFLVVLLTGWILISSPAPAQDNTPTDDSDKTEAVEKKKKGKNDPEKLLAKAQTLYERGKYEKAVQQYQVALAASDDGCRECSLGMFRSAAARGRFEEIVPYAGALLDAAAQSPEEDDAAAVLDEVEAVFRRALEASGGSDPDILWGLFDVLARRGEAAEIARLAERYLKRDEDKSLLCGADIRASLGPGETLSVADEVNEQLRGLGWDGPFLVSSRIRRPRMRNRAFTPGQGARMAGVVDRTGFLRDVRVVRPPPEKIGMNVRDKVRRATYDPATYRGQRIAVCFPFSVTLPGQTVLALQGGSGDSEGGLSPLFVLIQGIESAEAILELVEKAGANLILSKRAAICAARAWQEELNPKLFELEWPGPFFDTEDVEDPAPQHTPQAEYTDQARAAGVEGEVVLSTVISKTGKVVHVEILETLPEGLTGQAVNAVRTWTFEPAERDGEAIPVCRKITVEFKLD